MTDCIHPEGQRFTLAGNEVCEACGVVVTYATPQEELAQGHLFRFTVSTRGVGTVVGDPHIWESNWWSDPWTLEVRAHSLKGALEKAIELGMGAWDTGEKDDVDV